VTPSCSPAARSTASSSLSRSLLLPRRVSESSLATTPSSPPSPRHVLESEIYRETGRQGVMREKEGSPSISTWTLVVPSGIAEQFLRKFESPSHAPVNGGPAARLQASPAARVSPTVSSPAISEADSTPSSLGPITTPTGCERVLSSSGADSVSAPISGRSVERARWASIQRSSARRFSLPEESLQRFLRAQGVDRRRERQDALLFLPHDSLSPCLPVNLGLERESTRTLPRAGMPETAPTKPESNEREPETRTTKVKIPGRESESGGGESSGACQQDAPHSQSGRAA
jgi:hypothetical protein